MKTTRHQQAFNLFFQTDLTRKQIADLLNIDRKTLFTWIKEGQWLRARNAARTAPSLLVEQYYNQLCELNLHIARREEQPYPTREEAEVIRKLSVTITQFNKKRSVCETMDVLTDFHQHLFRHHQADAKHIVAVTGDYVRTLIDNDTNNDYQKFLVETTLRNEEYRDYLREQAELTLDDHTPITPPQQPNPNSQFPIPNSIETPNPNPNSKFLIPNPNQKIPNSNQKNPDSIETPNSKFLIPNPNQKNPNSNQKNLDSIETPNPNSQFQIPNSIEKGGENGEFPPTPETTKPATGADSRENQEAKSDFINGEIPPAQPPAATPEKRAGLLIKRGEGWIPRRYRA